MSSNINLEAEMSVFDKLYTDVVYAKEDIGQFVDKDDLLDRRYVRYLPALKDYVEVLKAAATQEKFNEKNRGFFAKLFGMKKENTELVLGADCKSKNRK